MKKYLSWNTVQDYLLVLLGALVQAFAMRLFLIPSLLVSGGVSGAAQVINYFTGWQIGLMTFIATIPLFIIGWNYLGGARFALRTAVATVAFSLFTDLLVLFIPEQGVTSDLVLDALFGGILLGAGLGMVYRGKGTSGGGDILCRILNRRLGISISTSYLAVDTLIVMAGGFAFGWERALYGLVVIYVSGLAAEMVSEGEGVLRTAMIVTTCGNEVAQKILVEMERGVTVLPGTGAYTGEDRPVLYCVVTRAEVNQLKMLVGETDPKAFMVIGTAHEALGEGFRPLTKTKKA